MSYNRRTWNAINRQKAAYRRAMRPIFRRALDKQLAPFWRELAGQPDLTLLEIPPVDNSGMAAAFKKLYYMAAMNFALDEIRRAKNSIRETITKEDEDIDRDGIQQAIEYYLENFAGKTITATGDTTLEYLEDLVKKLVPKVLDSGAGGGEAQTMLRDAIESEWHRARYFRTERIARTEVNRASNYGSLRGIQSTGIPFNKLWLSAFTKSSRQPHMDASGQRVNSDDPFIVDNEDLQYPGDPAGSPGNTINCLCSMTYETKELIE